MKKFYRVDYYWLTKPVLRGEKPRPEAYDSEFVEADSPDEAIENFLEGTFDLLTGDFNYLSTLCECEPDEITVTVDAIASTVSLMVGDDLRGQYEVFRAVDPSPEED